MTTEERLNQAVKRVSDIIRSIHRAAKECGVSITSISAFKSGCHMDMNLSTVCLILSRYITEKMPIPSQDEFSEALGKASKEQIKALYLEFGHKIYKIRAGNSGITTGNACRLADAMKKEGLFEMTENSQPMSARILLHVAALHAAGIIADDAKATEEWEEWKKVSDPIEGADFYIAYTSRYVFDTASRDDIDFPAAIAKNQRRLDWMKDNPDPTKTPIELWKAAKIALKEVRS